VQQRVTVTGRHAVGALQQVLKLPGIIPQRPGGSPAAQRRSTRRSSLTSTVCVVPSAVSNSSEIDSDVL